MCGFVRGGVMVSRDTDQIDNETVAGAVREALARRRLSRQAVAEMARVSLSTLEKALAGTRPFTLATVIRLEEALGTRLREVGNGNASSPVDAGPTLADDSLGAYSRQAVRWIEGAYLTLRPSFSEPDGIYSYVTTIRWIDDAGHLGYAESKRTDADFEQVGQVSMPHLSGHIYLVTNEGGQYRMMMLGRPTVQGTLYGVLSTLEVGHGSQLVPSVGPVVLMRLDRITDPEFGLIAPGKPAHRRYRAVLDEATAQDFVRIHR
ncbi:helix-turn-helix transcriptional regulator [Spectribacter hydrogenoxidans]|uniref:Helix-turn-helix transcriptional regulator n=1 Tax=Spectribacter hydrogenoxidans TaxID=3075608 RepID=A0ABU3C4C4_9GAMM|nr:helix-turn-helix transcriptional regulator [Salinisphaera sp. W335]MDT0636399.1 helix-turn-helix transcriptional regulator [Salinisphaera sp. W335]